MLNSHQLQNEVDGLVVQPVPVEVHEVDGVTWTHNEGSALLGWVALEIEEWSRHCPPQAPEAAREEAGLDVGALA